MVEVTDADKEIAAELAHALGMTAEEFTSGACDVLVQFAARHRQAGVQQGLDMAKAALEADATLCDCHARCEGECACGAWHEWKSITSARAVEIVSKLGCDDA